MAGGCQSALSPHDVHRSGYQGSTTIIIYSSGRRSVSVSRHTRQPNLTGLLLSKREAPLSSTRFFPIVWRIISRLTRDGTPNPSRETKSSGANGNGHFPCSADYEQDWQAYTVDPYSALCDYRIYMHTYKCRSRCVARFFIYFFSERAA